MSTRRGIMLVLVGCALLGVTMLQAWTHAAPPTALVAPDPATRRVAAEGRVTAYPGGEVDVAAERSGRLVRVLVEEGDVVRRGALLAEVDSEELRATLAEARARVTEAEAEARLAELNRQRREQLVGERVAAPHELDQAVRDLDIARARIETTRAAAARYEAQMKKTRIVAPIGGTVVGRLVDAGERVEAGARIVRLVDLSRLRVAAEADEADAALIAVGAQVTINAQGRPEDQWTGVVEEVADSVTVRGLKPRDPARPTDTRILAVKVAFKDKAPLKLGTTVDLTIVPALH